eukprot:TRINITY_DN9122_c0_g1_i5.p1 TRINITY_DN9122_c0_g1~~TRINITY_DN9122_c0_g1_i5.p1  ORF type:complete len:967 (+),score=142.68 TRINITY_DN9122_c0_g1_i5:321-3221(+)
MGQRCAPALVNCHIGSDANVDACSNTKAFCQSAIDQGIEASLQAPLPCTQASVDALAAAIYTPPTQREDLADIASDEALCRDENGKDFDQHHLFAFANDLDDAQAEDLMDDVDFILEAELGPSLRSAVKALRYPLRSGQVAPPRELVWKERRQCKIPRYGASVTRQIDTPKRVMNNFRIRGLEIIGTSTVAVVILAGSTERKVGQGVPTGIANIGLLSEKTLFELFCQRIIRLKHLVNRHLSSRRNPDSAGDELPGETTMQDQASESKDHADVADHSEQDTNGDEETRTAKISVDQITRDMASFALSIEADSISVSSESIPRASSAHQEIADSDIRIPLFIMCNADNLAEIQETFKTNDFYGLPEEDVTCFVQQYMPVVDLRGHVLLEDRHTIAFHPDGGGSVYKSMLNGGVIAEMKSRNIEHVFLASQDNILLRVADPVFIGYCRCCRQNAGIKCVHRLSDSSFMGIFCNRSHGSDTSTAVRSDRVLREGVTTPAVVESNEMEFELRYKKKGGVYEYEYASIAQLYFHMEAFNYASLNMPVRWHAVKRRQPSVDPLTGAFISPPAHVQNAIRLESYFADALELMESAVGFAVQSEEEWATVKAVQPGESDSEGVMSAVLALGRLHNRWIVEGGGRFKGGLSADCQLHRCEVSPLVSYAGEDMVGPFQGLLLPLPFHCKSGVEGDLPPNCRVPSVSGGTRGSAGISKMASVNTAAYDEDECCGSSSALCTTPSSLASERENWKSKLNDQIAEHWNQETRKKMRDSALRMLNADDPAATTAPLSPVGFAEGTEMTQKKGKRSSIGTLEVPSADDFDAAALLARASHTTSRSDKPGEEVDAEAEGGFVDAFEQALRDGVGRDRELPKLAPVSSFVSRQMNGALRRPKFGIVHEGTPTLLGLDSGYVPKPKKGKERRSKMTELRLKQYGDEEGLSRALMIPRGFNTTLPRGRQKHQWVVQGMNRIVHKP